MAEDSRRERPERENIMPIAKRKLLVTFLVYACAVAIVRLFAVDNAAWLVGADMSAYILPAQGLLQNGTFAPPNADELTTFLTPLYSTLIAANIWVFGDDAGLYATIYQQTVLLFLTGLLVAMIVALTHPHLAFVALLLMIFNPNSFVAAHGIQTETLFTFLLALTLLLFFWYVRTYRFWLLPALGLLVAAMAYCRPTGVYLGLAIPIGAAIYATIDSPTFREGIIRAGKEAARSLTVVVVAAVLLSPWYVRNHSLVGEYVLSTNLGLYLRDNIMYVYTKTSGRPVQEMSRYFDERFDDYLKRHGSKPRDQMNAAEESRAMAKFTMLELREQPIASIVVAAAQSVVFLYGSGGTGTLRDLWDIEGQGIHAIESQEGDGSVFGSAILFLERISPGYLLIVFTGLAYVFLMRLLGLVGFVAMLKSRHWREFVIYAGMLALFTAMYLFLGQPRFRLPLEPILVIIAVWGWDALGRLRQRS